MKDRLWAVAVFGMLALTMWVLAGCGGSSSTGTGQIRVSLVDAPLNADEINVEIASVQVHRAGGGWVTLKEYDPALPVNLLDYSTGGSSLLLADCPLDAGHYTMIRLMLSKAEVVVGSETSEVDLTNVSQTGVKCNGQFTVASGQLIALVLDFNAERSFVYSGGSYALHPVMTMSPQDVATEVTGTVELQDSSGSPIALPEGLVVNVYPTDHAGEADLLVASAAVGADGTFTIPVLAQGTYDIQIWQGDTILRTLKSVAITPPATDLGTTTIQQQEQQQN